MKLIRTIFGLILLSWGLGFFYFIHVIQDYVLDNKTLTEAILVFGSSNKQRLYTATELLKFGYAPLILITGDDDLSIYKNYLKEQGIPEYQFIFDPRPTEASNDYSLDTYYLLKRYKIYSIRLVMSAEELPRATIELARHLPDNISVVPHPVSLKKKNYNSIFIEYNKYLLIILAPIFGLQNDLNLSYS